VPDGEVGQGGNELIDGLSLLLEAQEPPPGHGDRLGSEFDTIPPSTQVTNVEEVSPLPPCPRQEARGGAGAEAYAPLGAAGAAL
jgi:hypothetical protein